MSKIYAVIAVLAVVAFLDCLGGGQPAGGNQTNQSQPGGTAGPTTIDVAIQGNAFSQTAINLRVGDSVKWTNKDDRIHQVQIITVTSSPVLRKDDSWTYKFTTAGTYNFRDAELPYMQGTVTVS